MQNLLQDFLSKQGPALIQTLSSKLGFTQQQASGFLGAIVGNATKVLGTKGFDAKTLLGGGTGALLAKLDLPGIAKQVGIDAKKADAGAAEVVPSLLKHLEKGAGGLEGMLGKVGGGGLAKSAGDLLGR